MWPFLSSIWMSSYFKPPTPLRLLACGKREQEGMLTVNLPPRQVIPQILQRRIQHRSAVEAGQRRCQGLIGKEKGPLMGVGCREGRDDGCCYFAGTRDECQIALLSCCFRRA